MFLARAPQWIFALLTVFCASDAVAAEAQRTSESVALTLPVEIYASVGVEYSIYFDNVVRSQNSKALRFEVKCKLGRTQARRWRIQPAAADVGRHPFAISIRDAEGKKLATAESTLVISPKEAVINREARLLIIGDSLTHATAYPNEIARLLSSSPNPDWRMLGTHKPKTAASGVAHEGYGGWTWQRFVSKYEPNPDGTHRKRSSPFVYLGSNGKPELNVKRYLREECDGQAPDFIIIMLGINDCFSAPVDQPAQLDARIKGMFGYAEKLIGAFREAAPKAEIGICLTTPPNSRGGAFQANYKGRYPRWGWKRIQHRIVQLQLQHYSNSTDKNIFLVPTQLNLDPIDGYPENNGVHPNSLGYQQVGASIYAWLKWRFQQQSMRVAPSKEQQQCDALELQEDAGRLELASFQVDATPPLGSPLCHGGVKPAREITTPLTGRGVVLLGAGKPIVLCAFDWVGIGNESHSRFRDALAEAVKTSPDRVTVHTLHQHDAPGSDLATELLLSKKGLSSKFSNADFDLATIRRAAAAARKSLARAQPVTHIGLGAATVEKVASNRRILGPDGRVAIVRLSASRSAKAQAAPEGAIDPLLRLIAFYHGSKPIASLTYYATHPQSYYGQGAVNWDFVGMARQAREKANPEALHLHFNGAGGNVAAGKYNDGSKPMRQVLAQRLANGMERAWRGQKIVPIEPQDVVWSAKQVSLPVRSTLSEKTLLAKLEDLTLPQRKRIRAARDLVFVRRMAAGKKITLSCLRLGDASILHMPGELFVEYQLAAQKMQPSRFVAMAAYGDYGPGYIGTAIAYQQGGYETGIVSRVAPSVESILLNGMRELLQASGD